MNILDKIFGRSKSGATVYEAAPKPTLIVPTSRVLRRGMWVKVGGKVAILNDFRTPTEAEVHLVDGDGLTVEVRTAPLDRLEPAGYKDIPAKRRPTAARARALGYV